MTDPVPMAFVANPVGSSSLAAQTGNVTYRSGGACLLIGPLERAMPAMAALDGLSCTVLDIDPGSDVLDKRLLDGGTAVFRAATLTLRGHLGDFSATAAAGDTETDLAVATWQESGRFDLVLDLREQPAFEQRLPPPGFVHVPGSLDDAHARGALAELKALVGEFDKPRYFSYRADICAHSRSRLDGCSRCIDACAAGAIQGDGDGVVIDPYLCQGCGSCATGCPTGAMRYAYPALPDAVQRTRTQLAAMATDVLVLHTESDQSAVDAVADRDGVLALAVEQVYAFGIDYWLTALCGGVRDIVLIVDEPQPGDRDAAADAAVGGRGLQVLDEQIALLHRLLDGLGREPAVSRCPADAIEAVVARLQERTAGPAAPSAAFQVSDDKRATVRAALDTLSEVQPPREPVLALPPGAPFGRLLVDTDACTLCMACVSTCPAGALLDGQDTPALRFIEANCVQCGLCEQACPETAIAREARYVWDSVEARRTQVLHEEPAFHCVTCHKPFATRRMIETMTEKLSGHWMFGEAPALRRLKMCEDCRVKDLFEREPAGPVVHRDPDRSRGDGGSDA